MGVELLTDPRPSVRSRARLRRETGESYLDETNVGGLLAEALTADVEAVLADQTSGVGADAAVCQVSLRSFKLFLHAQVCPPSILSTWPHIAPRALPAISLLCRKDACS